MKRLSKSCLTNEVERSRRTVNHREPVLSRAGTTCDPAGFKDSGTTFSVSSQLWKHNRFYWRLGRQMTALALKTPVLRAMVRSREKEMLSERRGRVAVLIHKGKSEKQEAAGLRRRVKVQVDSVGWDEVWNLAEKADGGDLRYITGWSLPYRWNIYGETLPPYTEQRAKPAWPV